MISDDGRLDHAILEYSRIAWYFTTLWGNGNSMLCKVLLFEKSDHKPFKRPVKQEGLMARNVSLK